MVWLEMGHKVLGWDLHLGVGRLGLGLLATWTLGVRIPNPLKDPKWNLPNMNPLLHWGK